MQIVRLCFGSGAIFGGLLRMLMKNSLQILR